MIESKGHKITPIDGDLAVSRNAEIGGDADIHGKARVAGSLKVEGFLDAPNIKGAVKGLFATEEELKREYPNPRPGWCAIVLADDERGFLYLAKNREWEKQSEEAKPFDFIADSVSVFASKGELAEETQRAQGAENILTQRIVNETVRATEAENEIKKNAVKFNRIGITGYADKLELRAATIDGDEVHYIDIPAATETKAGVVSAEDKKKFVKSITWDNDNDPSNMNDIVVAGVYDIKGEHTREDNLPILNTGGGHSFNARLTVLDSSISGSGKDDDKCITQVLSFSNRLGQGEIYIRTGKGSSLDNLTWEKWSTLQRNVNVGEVNSLDNLIDNGIYSGVLTTTGEMFVLVVINNYAVAGNAKSVSQFKYSIPFGGSFAKYETRVGGGNPVSFPYAWEILNKSEIDSMIKSSVDNAIKGVIADAPEAFDTLKEIADWIANDETGAVALANAIRTEIQRAQTMEQQLQDWMDADKQESQDADAEIRANAMQYNTLGVNVYADKAELYGRSIDGKPRTMDFPAATTEKAGVMSAEDKVLLTGITGTGYDSAIVEGSYLSDTGSPNSNAGYKRTNYIPVIEGATLSVTGRKVCAYNENKQFVSVLSNSGGDIIIPSQVRYIRVDAAKTSVLDITRDGSQLLGVALLQDVCNANNSFKNIYSKYTLSSGYYSGSSGIAQANNAYVKTDYIRVSGNVYFNIRCLRACFYDADKKFLSSIEGAKEHIVVPEYAVYVTFSYPKTDVEGKNLVIYGDRINEFIVYKDEFESAIKQLREEVTDAYVTRYTNNLTNEQDDMVTVVSGEYGAVGAKYSVPVKCTGKYSLHFEFKYPTTEDGSRIEILRFANISKTASTNGGVRMYIDNKGYIISEQQIRSGRVVALAPITSDNNYVARIGTSTSYTSLQTGNDAFSLRYLGSNQTATMSITDSGLAFTGVAEVNAIPFPSNASMLDFANTLKSLCSEGGSLNGVFDFAAYDVFGRSTADLTKVADIPLYYTYSYGADNFPVFVPYNDDNWHSVDIVFDSSATKGWDLLSFFFDGYRVNYVDGGFTLTGNGEFNTNVTIGGDGIAVRNLKYTDRCTKIDAPVISIEMLHNIKDELSLGGQDRISVSEIERVIAVYKKHGYKHIPLSEISQYMRGNKALSGKYFCLVHDDYFYSSPKLLNLYKGMDCKVCFAIINELLLDEVADEYKKNSSQFEYAIHSETSYASLKYDSLVQKVRSDMANLGNRLNSITNMLVYPYGATNRGVGKVFFHEGITVALTVGDNRVSMNCNPMILPRMPSRATGAFENLDSQLANIDKYYKE